MISVQEAKKIVLENCTRNKISEVPILSAGGFVLAETIYSPIDTPPFDQSAMDGYAFSFDDWDKQTDLLIAGEVQAGNYFTRELHPNQAIRIFTGAALPQGADTVVIQEKTDLKDGHIHIQDDKLAKGSNVRRQGSQTKAGEISMIKNQLLTPAALSFLAGVGIEKVKIFSNPRVSIIVTGKELIKPGQPMQQGKIYESNSFGITAALAQLNITPASVEMVDDDEKEIESAIRRQLESDMIILTGGVSVGDYDFVSSALEKCGVEKIFHKVKQKPGKPFYFGKYQDTLVFGLPGNPASVLTCFYEYVAVAISSFTQKQYFKNMVLPLANSYSKKGGLTFFLKGKVTSGTVEILKNQESYMMNSFAVADCLIELDEDKEQFEKGEMVPVLMIV